MSYPFNIRAEAKVQITGINGTTLNTGDVVTGEDNLRAVTIENGYCKVTYELPDGAEEGACHLYIMHDGEWRRCFRPGYGDWTFWVSPLQGTADRIVVLQATPDVVEISIEWTAHDLDTGYLGTAGLVSRDYARSVNYPSSSSNPKLITEVHLRKVVRVERGVQGYWLAWRSDPNVVPMITGASALANNEANLGEREFGTGGGTAVAWASTGNVAYFDAWRDQRDWSAVTTALPSFDNFAWWPGIDDATYPPWNHATVIAMQPAGYPAEASGGTYYIADIPASSYGGYANVCRYLVQKNPNEIGVWCYAGQLGEVVNHFTNPWTESDGRLTRYQVFIGAVYHAPDATAVAKAGYTGNVDYGNEPTSAIQATIAARAAAVLAGWPT